MTKYVGLIKLSTKLPFNRKKTTDVTHAKISNYGYQLKAGQLIECREISLYDIFVG